MYRKLHARVSFSKGYDYLKKKKKTPQKNLHNIAKPHRTFAVTFTFSTRYIIFPTFTNYFETMR